jgi:rhamnosyltransferase
MVSIVILTKNPGKRFREVIRQVFNQKTEDDFEVIVIDSGTTDGSLSCLENTSAKLIKINPSDFGHGKTRNYAANIANGKFLVFLSQDATPANENWLNELIRPLKEDEKVAGVYSKQIPYEDASIMEKCFLSVHYPDTYQVKEKKSKKELTLKDVFFSNVSSAMRKELLLRFRFPDDLIMSEDQAWSKEVIQHGYKIVYNPKSIVYHSHNYSLIRVFQRFFDSGASLKDLNLKAGNYKESIKVIYEEIKFCLKELGLTKFLFYLPYVAAYEFMRHAGFILGQNYKRLPQNLLPYLSFHKYYWNKNRLEK